MTERISIDNGLLNHLCKDAKGIFWNSFLDIAASKNLRLKDRKSFLLANEMEFLEFIGLGTILEEVPSTLLGDIKHHVFCLFNQQKPVELYRKKLKNREKAFFNHPRTRFARDHRAHRGGLNFKSKYSFTQ